MESSADIAEFILSTLSDAFNLERKDIAMHSQLGDLGFDSMNMTALIAHVEASYSVEFSADQVLELLRAVSIGDLVNKLSGVILGASV